jgi:hypothetical protein
LLAFSVDEKSSGISDDRLSPESSHDRVSVDIIQGMSVRLLKSFFSTPDELLATGLPRLGEVLLQHLKSYEGGRTVHQPIGGFNRMYFVQMMEGTARGLGPTPTQAEYGARQPAVTRRMQEAWNWLVTNGYLMHNPDQPGPDWFVMTTEGETLLERLNSNDTVGELDEHDLRQLPGDAFHRAEPTLVAKLRAIRAGLAAQEVSIEKIAARQGSLPLPASLPLVQIFKDLEEVLPGRLIPFSAHANPNSALPQIAAAIAVLDSELARLTPDAGRDESALATAPNKIQPPQAEATVSTAPTISGNAIVDSSGADSSTTPSRHADGSKRPIFSFSNTVAAILAGSQKLADQSRRNVVSSSCLLFAFAESTSYGTASFVRTALSRNEGYEAAFNRFLRDSSGTSHGITVEGLPGRFSPNTIAMIEYAAIIAPRVSGGRWKFMRGTCSLLCSSHQRPMVRRLPGPG